MRIIIEAFGRVWGTEFNLLHVKMVSSADQDADEQEHIGHDPHSTLSSQVEHGPGVSEYGHDVVSERKFGFSHGSEG